MSSLAILRRENYELGCQHEVVTEDLEREVKLGLNGKKNSQGREVTKLRA